MKIEKIKVYQVDLPLKEQSYKWSDSKSISTFDSTVVEVITDSGISGFGEVCPLGPSYLPAYAAGVRAGLKEICPQLLGENPLELNHLNDTMDYMLKGHPYVKSAIDVACWDILGKFTGLPACTLLGGKYGESVVLYKAISQDDPKAMRENVLKYKGEGYHKFQLKLGGDPDVDIQRLTLVRRALDDWDTLVGDANTGWLPHEALRVCHAMRDLDVYIEQPCASYEECLSIRTHTNRPFILDESIDSVQKLIQCIHDQAADVVNLKISRLGGLTRTKQARDLCVTMGLGMCIEDTWGSDIATAAILHLAHSTPEKYRFSSTDFNSYNTVKTAHGLPIKEHGTMAASDMPGLGIQPIMDVLGDTVMEI